ncbi:uncharacterized protein DSM5745_09491 [Aspergillus mulundensis]|uniref:F-box domain-containing protein n=1 Tax=Aspergillus mulundensis TaxID=1810919 RepID=A0A3D8QVG0_9EURO|nr:hypothetical protein DSM5745_09491 [Aspergillus mulundensis]RDW65752.1 hypothetical protein DSM5745_09491 [Aspergillus mulundensis]
MESLQDQLDNTSLRPTGILDLPPELMSIIASDLEVCDLRSLRLASMYLNNSTFYIFSRRAFKELRIDFSAASWHKISNVINRPDLIPLVESLVVQESPRGSRPRTSPVALNEVVFGAGFEWARDSSGTLNHAQDLVQIWQSALARLVEANCKSFSINRREQSRTVGDEDEEGRYLHLTDLHSLLMVAFASARCSAGTGMERYEICWGRYCTAAEWWSEGGWLDDGKLDMSHMASSQFKDAWSGIRELRLNIELGYFSDGARKYLISLLKLAPNLETLYFDFVHGECATLFIKRLGWATVKGEVQFRLKSLHFSNARMGHSDIHIGPAFLTLLRRHRETLQHLTLKHIRLGPEGLPSLINFFRDEKLRVVKYFHFDSLGDFRGSDGRKRGLRFPVLDEGVRTYRRPIPPSAGVGWYSYREHYDYRIGTCELELSGSRAGRLLRGLHRHASYDNWSDGF